MSIYKYIYFFLQKWVFCLESLCFQSLFSFHYVRLWCCFWFCVAVDNVIIIIIMLTVVVNKLIRSLANDLFCSCSQSFTFTFNTFSQYSLSLSLSLTLVIVSHCCHWFQWSACTIIKTCELPFFHSELYYTCRYKYIYYCYFYILYKVQLN